MNTRKITKQKENRVWKGEIIFTMVALLARV